MTALEGAASNLRALSPQGVVPCPHTAVRMVVPVGTYLGAVLREVGSEEGVVVGRRQDAHTDWGTYAWEDQGVGVGCWNNDLAGHVQSVRVNMYSLARTLLRALRPRCRPQHSLLWLSVQEQSSHLEKCPVPQCGGCTQAPSLVSTLTRHEGGRAPGQVDVDGEGGRRCLGRGRRLGRGWLRLEARLAAPACGVRVAHSAFRRMVVAC